MNRIRHDELVHDVLDYIAMTGPMVFRPLRFLAAGLSNVEIVPAIQHQGATFGFLVQIGDLVCTHAETYSRIPNKASTTVNHWIHSFAVPSGIV